MIRGKIGKRIVTAGIAVMTLFICCAALVFSKAVNLNQYLVSRYEMRGVDVSHYQGEIDWEKLEDQGTDFAFIKATEGSSHADERFTVNWEAAGQTGIYVGAYHFFSFDSDGRNQADWYIQTVGELDGKLAPVVDVEYYGDKETNPPGKEQVSGQLHEFLKILEDHYGIRPVIYTTYKVYRRYIKDEFDEYPLWIRNVYYSPNLDMRGRWQFWQYMDREVLEGYEGEEKYIDMNVFAGSEDAMKEYVVNPAVSDSDGR